jgi:hypothetical protein
MTASALNDAGGEPVSAFKRIVRLAKFTTLLSGVFTILCTGVVFGLQVTSWLQTGLWEAYQLSSVMGMLKSDRNDVYVTASTDKFQTELTSTQLMVDWLLGIPTVLFLLVVAGLHVFFYLYLVNIEKQRDIGG